MTESLLTNNISNRFNFIMTLTRGKRVDFVEEMEQ